MANEYTGKEWTELLRELDPKAINNVLRSTYRRLGKEGRKIVERKVVGITIMGSRADLMRSIRSYVYRRGAGFAITTAANPRRKKGYHKNRFGKEKPVMQWLDDGTKERSRRGITGGRRGRTGSIEAKGYTESARTEVFQMVERELPQAIEVAVQRAAKKAGLI